MSFVFLEKHANQTQHPLVDPLPSHAEAFSLTMLAALDTLICSQWHKYLWNDSQWEEVSLYMHICMTHTRTTLGWRKHSITPLFLKKKRPRLGIKSMKPHCRDIPQYKLSSGTKDLQVVDSQRYVKRNGGKERKEHFRTTLKKGHSLVQLSFNRSLTNPKQTKWATLQP